MYHEQLKTSKMKLRDQEQKLLAEQNAKEVRKSQIRDFGNIMRRKVNTMLGENLGMLKVKAKTDERNMRQEVAYREEQLEDLRI